MVLTLVALLIVAGVVFRGMTPDERAQAARRAIEFAKDLKYALRTRPEETVFHDALKERCPWAIATLALVALNAVVFLFMLLGSGSFADPKTLLGWGGSIGPRTTNGEWWRVATSMFVHAGLFQLLITLAALIQVGSIVERLVGRESFAAVYFTSGAVAILVHTSGHRAAVGYGASGAVFGIYGLFLAFMIWSRFHETTLIIPRPAVKKLVPAAVLFLLYNAVADSLSGTAELTSLAVGLICGLVLMTGAPDPRPETKRLGGVVATAVVVVLASAFSLRGIADVWPELQRIVSAEESAATVYTKANDLFNKRRMTADALADMIEQKIIPELADSQERLKAIRKVPQEHQALLDDANKYVGLRSESWRSRAEGLRKIELRALLDPKKTEQLEVPHWRRRAEAQHRANLSLIGNAEGKAKAALVVLERIKTRLRSGPTPV